MKRIQQAWTAAPENVTKEKNSTNTLDTYWLKIQLRFEPKALGNHQRHNLHTQQLSFLR